MTISIGGPPSGAALAAQLAGATIPGALTVAGLLTTQAGQTNSGGIITSSSGINTTGVAAIQAGGSLIAGVGDVQTNTAGQGLQIKGGANAKIGTAVLVAGTVTVADTSVTANSKIFVVAVLVGGTQGILSVPSASIVPGTSFVINSSNAADTSTVLYMIVEQG